MHKPVKLSAIVVAALTLCAGSSWAARVVNQKSIEDDAPYAGFIVKYRAGAAEQASAAGADAAVQALTDKLRRANVIDVTAKANPGRPFAIEHVRQLAVGANLINASRKLRRAEALAMVRELAADPNVEYVEPNLILQHALTPNDSLYSQQWGYGAAGIGAEAAWNKSNGAGVTVAVLDTGITSHPDLNANVVGGYDFITDAVRARDANGRDANAADPGDTCNGSTSSWHGTHVAGTVAAVTNNASGVAGTAFGAKVMPVRVLGACGGTVADISDAITWSSGGAVAGVTSLSPAAAAKVINMSLSGAASTCSTTYQTAINGAVSRGTTVVVAAGNNNLAAQGYQPANCANVITVGATDSSGAKASFSNFGSLVDVSAPGVSVLSTWNTGITAPGTTSYAYYNGTSMAAPHVAGAVALIQSRRLAAGRPLMTPAAVEQLLKVMARPLPVACSVGCGAGIVNAAASVDVALTNGVPVLRQTDASGKIESVMIERLAPAAAAAFNDFAVELPEDYLVVGGGVEATNAPVGHLLTASHPDVTRNAWVVGTKDHLASNPHQIKAWAIGIKVTGLSRAALLSNMRFQQVTSAVSAAPLAVTPGVPMSHMLLNGGFKVGPNAVGNLGTASFPRYNATLNIAQWVAGSKDHGVSSPASVTAYSIEMPRSISGIGSFSTGSVGTASGTTPTSHPVALVGSIFTDMVLVGCGGSATSTGPGQLLWKMRPFKDPVDGQNKCEVGSKDHMYSSPGISNAYVQTLRAY
nr:S8 family peptidase [uncultured Aquabacterium sp.]